MRAARISRRAVLLGGIGTVVATAGSGAALVDAGVLPGKAEWDRLTGGCAAQPGTVTYPAPGSGLGPTVSGSFFSRARRTTVGWTVSYPPGAGPRSPQPLVLALHGLGSNHAYPLGPVPPVRVLAARVAGRRIPPVAVAAVDGGPGYWHAHPGDDPMAMLTEEFLPLCRARGLGRQGPVGVTGTSMGGYGALLLAERRPRLVRAVAAISPAIFTSYADAHSVNATAFTSAADFAANDVLAHAGRLAPGRVRIASGDDDPLHPGAVAMAAALGGGTTTAFGPGCHDGAFFAAQAAPSLLWLGGQLRRG